MNTVLAFLPSGSEWIYILLIILLLFGGAKLPQLARGLGESIREFKRGKEEVEKEIAKTTTESPASSTKNDTTGKS